MTRKNMDRPIWSDSIAFPTETGPWLYGHKQPLHGASFWRMSWHHMMDCFSQQPPLDHVRGGPQFTNQIPTSPYFWTYWQLSSQSFIFFWILAQPFIIGTFFYLSINIANDLLQSTCTFIALRKFYMDVDCFYFHIIINTVNFFVWFIYYF